jgi:hypothetical protein
MYVHKYKMLYLAEKGKFPHLTMNIEALWDIQGTCAVGDRADFFQVSGILGWHPCHLLAYLLLLSEVQRMRQRIPNNKWAHLPTVKRKCYSFVVLRVVRKNVTYVIT